MEELMVVNVLEPLHDLKEYALDASSVQTFVISSFHQLIKITIHIFHADVKLLGIRIQEDIKRRNQMYMRGECPQENHFS